MLDYILSFSWRVKAELNEEVTRHLQDFPEEMIFHTSNLHLLDSVGQGNIMCEHVCCIVLKLLQNLLTWAKNYSFWKRQAYVIQDHPWRIDYILGNIRPHQLYWDDRIKGNCSLVQERQSGSLPYHHYRKDVWCLLEKSVRKRSAIYIRMLGLHGSKLKFLSAVKTGSVFWRICTSVCTPLRVHVCTSVRTPLRVCVCTSVRTPLPVRVCTSVRTPRRVHVHLSNYLTAQFDYICN